jgi:putative chitinase
MIEAKDIAAIGGAKARADICAAVADFIDAFGALYKLDMPARLHHFLGQCCVESAGFSTLEENLNYSVEGLKKTFGRHRISTADCERYGAIKGKRSANKSAIANLIYGGEFGKKQLGNTEPGDGWEFRGSSIKQITGRSNFRAFTKWIRKLFPDAPDFEAHPDLLRTLEWAVWPAVWYWVERRCYEFADRNDGAGLTKKINGGTNGLKERDAATRLSERVIGSRVPEPQGSPPARVPVFGVSDKPEAASAIPEKDGAVKPAISAPMKVTAAGGIGAAVTSAVLWFHCSLPQWFIDWAGYAAKCVQP